MSHYFVNCIGLKCPMPILKTRKVINQLHKGDQLLISADDPGFCKDFQIFCYQADLRLVEYYRTESKENPVHSFHVEITR